MTTTATALFSCPVLRVFALIGTFGLTGCQAHASDWNAGRTSWDRIEVESLAYDDATPPTGRIIEGAVDVNTFAPENTFIRVDAEKVDLRQIFEDLGPIATLWYQHVQTLANPFMEGRAPESRGIEIAKEYIEFYFRLYGLEPAFPAAGTGEALGGEVETNSVWVTYRQPFTFNSGGARIRAQVSDAFVAINGEELSNRDAYTFLGVSGSGHLTAPVSFVGYAIEDGEDGYTSFDEDTDLAGRIAMVLRYEPLTEEGTSQWSRQRFSTHASMANKLRNLRERNAAGIILVNPPGSRDGATRLETMGRSAQFGPAMTIPVVQVVPEVAERMLQKASPDSGDLLTWRRKADTGEVRTVHLDGSLQVTLAGNVNRAGARAGIETENVAAVLRGRGSIADQWIVVGGHLDHIGYGQFGASPTNRGKLHAGADDNASGTAGVLILARTLSEKYANMPEDAELRSIIFIGFSAEESGLHGSRHFASNLPVPADQITAVLNMDMIGRVRDNTISVMGTGTGEGLRDILKPHFVGSGLTVHTTPGSSGRSDDASFIAVNIPAVHVFSGMHAEYHAPEDQAYTINPAGARDTLRMLHNIAMDLAQRPEKLVFTTPERIRTADRGYGPVRLGIRPGMAADGQVPGVLIEDVSLGTPAEAAGLRSGDIITAWNGEPLDGMAGLFAQLQKHKPGDTVTLTIDRDGEAQNVDVTFPIAEE
jgi:hypothetical protein